MNEVRFEVVVPEGKAHLLRSFLLSNDFDFFEHISDTPENGLPSQQSASNVYEVVLQNTPTTSVSKGRTEESEKQIKDTHVSQTTTTPSHGSVPAHTKYEDVAHKTGVQEIQNKRVSDLTPKCLAAALLRWLHVTGISRKAFAFNVLHRQQSTFSDILNKAPERWPEGRGRWVYERIHEFLLNWSQQEELYCNKEVHSLHQGVTNGFENSIGETSMTTACTSEPRLSLEKSLSSEGDVVENSPSMMLVPGFAHYEDLAELTGIQDIQSKRVSDLTPKCLAAALTRWLHVTGISQKAFATIVLHRQQSTLSDILNKAPEKWPDGRGRWAYERIHEFLLNWNQQEELYTNKGAFDGRLKSEDRTSTRPCHSGEKNGCTVQEVDPELQLSEDQLVDESLLESTESQKTLYSKIYEKNDFGEIRMIDKEDVTPKDIAQWVDTWLRVTGISQKLFAAAVINRQQSTLSDILKRASDKWPDSRGRWVFERMYQFLLSYEEQEMVFSYRRAMNGPLKREATEEFGNKAGDEQDLRNDSLPGQIDTTTLNESVQRTGKFIVIDTGNSAVESRMPYSDIVEEAGVAEFQQLNMTEVSPAIIARYIKTWLRVTGVPNDVFSSCVLNRNEATLCESLEQAISEEPGIRFRRVYERLCEFLLSYDEQEHLYTERTEFPGVKAMVVDRESPVLSDNEEDVLTELSPEISERLTCEPPMEATRDQLEESSLLLLATSPAEKRIRYLDIMEETGVEDFRSCELSDLTPKLIAAAIDNWLRVTGIPQKYFAKTVLHRQQSTLSEILKRAPERWPEGRGRWVYERMYAFLLDQEEQERVFAYRKDPPLIAKRMRTLSNSPEPVEEKKALRESVGENCMSSFEDTVEHQDTIVQRTDTAGEDSYELVTPKELADQLLEWLKLHRISQLVFAKEILNRKQSTLSGLITNASSYWPKGQGKLPYIKMFEFLNNKRMQEDFLRQHQNHAERDTVESARVKSLGTGKRVVQIRRSMFGMSQKAALDRSFVACSGHPSSQTVKSIAEKLALEQHQVRIWFQNHRRLQKAGGYSPGQYQLQRGGPFS